MKVLIYGHAYHPHHKASLVEALKAMESEGLQAVVLASYWNQVEKDWRESYPVTIFEDFEKTPVEATMAFGGDGTMLGAVGMVARQGIPVLGINLGRLGFLSSIEGKDAAFAIHEFARGQYRYDERTLIQLDTSSNIFGDSRIALNDFTLHKRDNSSMITIHTYIDNVLLNSFWADGLIVATPTGSTGYSLSCGGPIVFPNSGNLVITPVAPHNLTVRPLVIPDSSVVTLEVEGRAETFLCTMDSRFEIITASEKLTLRRADVKAKLIQLYNYSFIRTLQEKLTWGRDSRN